MNSIERVDYFLFNFKYNITSWVLVHRFNIVEKELSLYRIVHKSNVIEKSLSEIDPWTIIIVLFGFFIGSQHLCGDPLWLTDPDCAIIFCLDIAVMQALFVFCFDWLFYVFLYYFAYFCLNFAPSFIFFGKEFFMWLCLGAKFAYRALFYQHISFLFPLWTLRIWR